MVAVVTGASLGVGRSSLNVLGSQSELGSPNIGLLGGNVYVDAATGNLVLTQQDDILSGVGQNAVVDRAYNSQGVYSADHHDVWQVNAAHISPVSGALNTVGSTVTRTDWDGSTAVYTFDTFDTSDTSKWAYVSSNGNGTYNTLQSFGSSWNWVDGVTQAVQTFDDATGRITSAKASDFQGASYSYSSGKLTSVVTLNGEHTDLSYGGPSGNRLTQLTTYSHDASGNALTRTDVTYTYDLAGRLETVTTNLAPEGNPSAGGTFVTTYGYFDGTSDLVASISQSDGSAAQIGYTPISGVYRVTSVTQTRASGTTETTTYSYDIASKVTTIIDPMGQATAISYDGQGNLLRITAPPPAAGAGVQSYIYTYDSDGNVLTASVGGELTTYTYSDEGLRLSAEDAVGTTTTYTYSRSVLQSSTTYLTPDPDGAESATASDPQTTRYVYNSANQLRFVISPEGHVTETKYDGLGRLAATIAYTNDVYTASETLSETDMSTWASGLAVKANVERTDYVYDYRGNLSSATVYQAVTSSGAGDTSAPYSRTTYVYDDRGRLLSSQKRGDSVPTTYTYDGLGRQLMVTDANGVATTTTYNDSTNTEVSTALGVSTTKVYDKAGNLLSVTQASLGVTSATTQYRYDNKNQLREVIDPAGVKTFIIYDNVGRKVADVDGDGFETEYVYDTGNNVVEAIRYADPLSGTQLSNLNTNASSPIQLSDYRPENSSDDQYAWKAYNLAGQLIGDIDGVGDVTGYAYDGAGQLIRTTQYANALSSDVLDSFKATPPTALITSLAPNGNDFWAWGHYYADVTPDATTAPDGTNTASQVTATGGTTLLYEGIYDAGSDSGNTFSIYVKEGSGATDMNYFGVYDRWSSTTLGGLYLDYETGEFSYDGSSGAVTNVGDGWWRIDLGVSGASQGDMLQITLRGYGEGSYNYVWGAQLTGTTPLPVSPSSDDRVTRTFYDADGRVIGTLDPTGALTQIKYNDAGQKVETVQYPTLVGSSLRATATFNQLLASVTNLGTNLWVDPTDGSSWQLANADESDAGSIDGVDAFQFSTHTAGALAQVATSGSTSLAIGSAATFTVTVQGVGTQTDAAIGIWMSGAANWGSDSDATIQILSGPGYVRWQEGGIFNISGLSTTEPTTISIVRKAAVSGNYTPLLYVGRTDTSPVAGSSMVVSNPIFTAGSQPAPITNRFINNPAGQLVATIDGEGDVTRYQYDVNGNVSQVITGQKLDPDTLLNGQLTLADLPAPASGTVLDTTAYTYNAFGQVLTQTKTLTGGGSETTTYAYDNFRRLIATTMASGTADARTATRRYDALGQLTGELSGDGSAVLAALGSSPSQAQIDAVYAQYGVTYTYDADGRVVARTTANGLNTAPAKSVSYYDADGQLIYSISALGEVTEYRHDAFGQRTDTISYANTLSGGASGLTGGLVNSGVASLVSALASGADSITHAVYNAAGEVVQTTDAAGAVSTFAYDTFGEVVNETDTRDNSTTVQTIDSYDRDGRLTQVVRDATGLQATTSYVYDAFGRRIQVVDPNNAVTTTAYDRAGRTIETTNALGHTQTFTYNGLGNVLTSTDGANQTTTYAYTAFDRQVTVTTPDSISTTTQSNAYGETVSISDGAGRTTTYAYDKDGKVASVTDAAGTTTSHYDAGNLTYVIGAGGSKTSYTYDADNRVLTRKVDDDGLNLVTTYAYSSANRQVSVTDPNGSVTTTTYDAAGRTVSVVVDAGRLNLTTSYTYDEAGRVLTQTDPDNHVVKYSYDNLGQLTQKQVDPTGLNLITAYTYDLDGNVVASTDPLLHTTRYVYDADGQLIWTVDAAGDVSKIAYDNDGRVVSQRSYATPLSLSGLPLAVSASLIAGAVVTSSKDRVSSSVYDGDGRLEYAIDGLGHVCAYAYDGSGNVLSKTEYANPITPATSYTAAGVQASLTTSSRDQTTRAVYDAAGRQAYSIDALGQVTAFTYDANGNVIKSVQYAAIDTAAGQPTLADMASWAASHTGNGDRVTRAVYNSVNEEAYSIDAMGDVTAFGYDANGNVIKSTEYAVIDTDSSQPTLTGMTSWVASHANVANDRVSRTVYDGANRAVYDVDAESYVSETHYDGDGDVTKRIVYADRYTVSDGVTQISLATQIGSLPLSAAVTAMSYDGADRLFATTNAADLTTSLQLDGNGNVLVSTVAFGTSDEASTLYSYDATGRVTDEWQGYTTAEVTHTGYGYDGVGNQITTTDGRGYTTTRVYDAKGHVLSVSVPVDALSSDNLVTANQYDGFGNLVKTVDPRVNAGYFYYDALNRLTLQVDPEGYVTATGYSRGGQTTSVTRYAAGFGGSATVGAQPAISSSEEGSTTIIGRDKLDRVTSNTDALNYQESYALNAFGDRVTVTNKLGGVTQNVYDKRGLLLQETLPDGTVNRYTYDSRGNRKQTVEAYGASEARTTNFDYDKLNRLIEETGDAVTVYDANLTATSGVIPTQTITYDARGNITETVDKSGAKSFKYYNHLNQKIAEVNGAGTLTAWTYDASGNVQTQKVYGDAIQGVLVAGQYYSAQRVDSVWVPDSTTTVEFPGYYIDNYDPSDTSGSYGANAGSGSYVGGQYYVPGYTQTITVPGYNTAAYDIPAHYGAASFEPLTAGGTPPNPVSANNVRTTTYVYDRNNRQIEVIQSGVDATGTGVVTGQYGSSGYTLNLQGAITTEKAYDADGNVVSETDGRGNSTFTYYDKLGRKIASVDTEGYLTAYTLDAEGNTKAETQYATRLTTVFSATSDVNALKTNAGSSPTDRTTLFEYDKNGNRTKETRIGAGGYTVTAPGDPVAGPANSVINYTYNALGEVLRKTEATLDYTDYSYDTQGRVYLTAEKAFTNAGENLVAQAEHTFYDGLNNVTKTVEGALGAPLTSGRTTTYIYGTDGRLASMQDPTGFTETYGYDAAGNVVKTQYDRVRSDGSIETDASVIGYDVMGRMVSQSTAEMVSGAWTFGDVKTIRTIRYNAFGDVAAKGLNGAWQEIFDYNVVGQLWRTTTNGGETTLIVNDANGNATLQIQSTGADLSTYSLSQALALLTTGGTVYAVDTVTGETGYWNGAGYTTAATVITAGYHVNGNDVPAHYLTSNYTEYGGDPVDTGGEGSGDTGATTPKYAVDNTNGEIGSWDGAGYLVADYQTAGYDVAAITGPGHTLTHPGAQQGSGVTVVSRSDMELSFASYDGRNLQTAELAPNRRLTLAGALASINTYTAYNAFGEVSRQTDARGNYTDYTYNTMGKVVLTQSPQVNYTLENGSIIAGRPTITNYYDASGRVIATKDANHNLTKMVLLANTGYGGSQAKIVTQTNADHGVIANAYDVYGDMVTSTNQQLHVTTYAYDGMDRLISETHASGLVDSYAYDGLGQKIKHSNSFLVGAYGATAVDTTDYDMQSRITTTMDSGGGVTTYKYTWDGSMVTQGLGTFGGWVKTTTAMGHTSTERDDYFGRTVSRIDGGGHTYNEVYDKAGRLVAERNSVGENTQYTYYNTGQISTIIELGSPSPALSNVKTTFEYDANGNKLLETYTADYTQPGHAAVNKSFKHAVATYDAMNRVITMSDTGEFGQYPVSISYEYDVDGNIRHMDSVYKSLVSGNPGTVQDYWYKYDSMERVVTSKGQFLGARGSGYIDRSTTGQDIAYDVAGQRVYVATGIATTQDVPAGYIGGTTVYPIIPDTTVTAHYLDHMTDTVIVPGDGSGDPGSSYTEQVMYGPDGAKGIWDGTGYKIGETYVAGHDDPTSWVSDQSVPATTTPGRVISNPGLPQTNAGVVYSIDAVTGEIGYLDSSGNYVTAPTTVPGYDIPAHYVGAHHVDGYTVPGHYLSPYTDTETTPADGSGGGGVTTTAYYVVEDSTGAVAIWDGAGYRTADTYVPGYYDPGTWVPTYHVNGYTVSGVYITPSSGPLTTAGQVYSIDGSTGATGYWNGSGYLTAATTVAGYHVNGVDVPAHYLTSNYTVYGGEWVDTGDDGSGNDTGYYSQQYAVGNSNGEVGYWDGSGYAVADYMTAGYDVAAVTTPGHYLSNPGAPQSTAGGTVYATDSASHVGYWNGSGYRTNDTVVAGYDVAGHYEGGHTVAGYTVSGHYVTGSAHGPSEDGAWNGTGYLTASTSVAGYDDPGTYVADQWVAAVTTAGHGLSNATGPHSSGGGSIYAAEGAVAAHTIAAHYLTSYTGPYTEGGGGDSSGSDGPGDPIVYAVGTNGEVGYWDGAGYLVAAQDIPASSGTGAVGYWTGASYVTQAVTTPGYAIAGHYSNYIAAHNEAIYLQTAVEYNAANGQTETGTWNGTGFQVASYVIAAHPGAPYNVGGTYDPGGVKSFTSTHYEYYDYDVDGNLTDVKTSQTDYYGAESAHALEVQYTRDAMGRVTTEQDYKAGATTASYEQDSWYDAASNVTQQFTSTVMDTGDVQTATTTNTYLTSGASALLDHAITVSQTNGGTASTSEIQNSYVWWGSAQQSVVKTIPDTGHMTTYYTSTYSYDNQGHLNQVAITGNRARYLSYITDGQGEVMARFDTLTGLGVFAKLWAVTPLYTVQAGRPAEFYYYFNGQMVGDIGNDGTQGSNMDFAQVINARGKAMQTAAFQNGSATSYANFDQSYQPINPTSQGDTQTVYTAQAGDNLMAIAQAVWGDSSLWYLIANANGVSRPDGLAAGMRLTIPSGVSTIHNNADTTRPYNTADAQGDVSPAAPKPKKSGCGVLGQIIMIIVAIVVTVITYGALTEGAGALLAGASSSLAEAAAAAAIAGAAGSIASQVVGIAIGAQDSFSWKGVALAALSAAIGGVPGLNPASAGSWIEAAGRGAASNVISQSIGVVTGLQSKFSWADVAVAGVMSGVDFAVSHSSIVTNTFGPPASNTGGVQVKATLGNAVVSGMAGALAGAATKSVINGTDFGTNLQSILPSVIGNTIGSLITGQLDVSDDWRTPTTATAGTGGGVPQADESISPSSSVAPISGGDQSPYSANCFPAGSLVHTRNGLRPIEEITVGDWVAARPELNAASSVHWRKVTRTFQHPNVPIVDLLIQHSTGELETISTTPEHLFFVNGGQWSKAAELELGTQLERKDGGRSSLVKVQPGRGLHTVYNFTVDQDHTYFVGNGGIWVHNHYGVLHRLGEAALHLGAAFVDAVTGDETGAARQWHAATVSAWEPEKPTIPDPVGTVATVVVTAPDNSYRILHAIENIFTGNRGVGGPHGATGAWNANYVTSDQLKKIYPQARQVDINRMVGPLNNSMAAHGVNSPAQQAAFLAQGGVETGQLRSLSENLNYSPARLNQVWPKRFPTEASAAPYAHDPKALADMVYDGRMGNLPNSDDGYTYRGRGFLQLTGRNNYTKYGYASNPDYVGTPQGAAESSGVFWQNNNLNTLTQDPLNQAQFKAVTKIVNGGLNGAGPRWVMYRRAIGILGGNK